MDSIGKQIISAVIVAAVLSGGGMYVTHIYGVGQTSNAKKIAEIEQLANKVPLLRVRMDAFEQRLSAYEKIVVEGHSHILAEISSINISNARTSAQIEGIQQNLNDIKKRMEHK